MGRLLLEFYSRKWNQCDKDNEDKDRQLLYFFIELSTMLFELQLQ